MGPMPNLSSAFALFLNPVRIQIWTQFLWVPVYYRYWAHTFLLFSQFSLSPPDAVLLLSHSAITISSRTPHTAAMADCSNLPMEKP
jgi:hypothetical protein